MTMSLQIIITAAQFTPDHEPVYIRYQAINDSGPFSAPHAFGTTQTALAARSGVPGYWSDVECKADLQAYLTANAIDAVVE